MIPILEPVELRLREANRNLRSPEPIPVWSWWAPKTHPVLLRSHCTRLSRGHLPMLLLT